MRFQRAAGLPEAAAALFAWAPYSFALSWCLPKVEAAGYGLAFAGLGLLLRRRSRAVALALAATFLVHTAAALFFGLCGGVLALAKRDREGLLALAVGCLLASPLLAAHLAVGCTPAQALLFSPGDYLRSAAGWSGLAVWDRVLVLSGPIAVACAALGAARLWREHRAVAIAAGVVVMLYANELWLAPLGLHTTLNLMRGLTIFAAPISLPQHSFQTFILRPQLAHLAFHPSQALCKLSNLTRQLFKLSGQSPERVPFEPFAPRRLD